MHTHRTGKTQPEDAAERKPSAHWSYNPKGILSWIYLGRIAVGAAILVSLPGDGFTVANKSLYITIILVAMGVVTVASYIYTHSLARHPRRALLYLQVVFDAFMLTAVVYLTGGAYSMFTPLYILVISAGALLLPILGGIVIGLFTSILFSIASVLSEGTVDGGMLLQATLFACVAIISGYLGDRLRQTGAALGSVETELRRLRLNTDEILETIGTGILTVDEQGRLAYINPAAAEMLDLEPREWIDRPIIEKLDSIAPGLGEVIERSATMRMPIRRYETAAEDDGFVIGVSTTIFDRPETERPPVTAIFQDITEGRRIEGLRRRAERLEAVAELSASLAHEIKNPLASIRSAVEQISAGELEREDRELLGGLIVRESDRLSRLLGEFIDFARVKLTAPQPLDFLALTRSVVDVVRAHPDTRERAVTIAVQAPDTPILIRGAEDLLHRAVFNLALNAVQWAGHEGRVELTLDEVRSDLLSPALGGLRLGRLSVRDSGPGVPEDLRDQIFDPFFTRREGGTGLGLALVQRAVEAHGGAIFVDAAPGGEGGAVFSLYLPTLPNDAEDEAAGLTMGNQSSA